MKKILIVLAGALIATAAVAQSTSPPGGDRDSYDRRDSDERRSFHERDGRSFDRDGRGPGWHDEMMMRHHGWGGGGRRGMNEEMRGGGMGGRSGGAHFRLQRGDARIDIRCGDNEPIGVCVEAAGRLIDKVMSLRGTGAESPAARPGGSPVPDSPRPQ